MTLLSANDFDKRRETKELRPLTRRTIKSVILSKNSDHPILRLSVKPSCALLKMEISYEPFNDLLRVRAFQLKDIRFSSQEENRDFFYSLKLYKVCSVLENNC